LCGKTTKGSPIGQQEREIQPERAAPRPCDAAPATQDDQGTIMTMCREGGRVV
jgi:hypothetical protein